MAHISAGKGKQNVAAMASEAFGDLSALSQGAISGVRSIFGKNSASKRARTAGKGAGSENEAEQNGLGRSSTYAGMMDGMLDDAPPFSEGQTDWLSDVVGESIQSSLSEFAMSFGRRMLDRLIKVETRVDKLETDQDVTIKKVNDLEGLVASLHAEIKKMKEDSSSSNSASSNQALNQRVEQMAEQLNTQKTKIEENERSLATSSSAARRVSAGEPPYETRTDAVLMNVLPMPTGIMNDDERRLRKEEVFKAAKEELMRLDVLQEWYGGSLAAMHNGKGATLSFDSHGHLQAARAKVNAANKVIATLPNGHEVKMFLDAAKTRSELRPALLCHRAADILHDLEKEKGQSALIIFKDMKGKTVKVGTERFGYSLNGVWQWTAAAGRRYSADELYMAQAYINGH